LYVQFRSAIFKEESEHFEDLIEIERIILKRITPHSSKLVPLHAMKAYGEVDV
jgi:hypothetical protein